ncbi:hypothetical protein [Granulicoccus phenolivorans]|uniref:hypothetical protein n=1 Tax=Granulicoccus phenolivorans TaxID=266854 RepID=UPI00047D0FE3|nr:hypothetical protein [Granulicoccus phenolivorans]
MAQRSCTADRDPVVSEQAPATRSAHRPARISAAAAAAIAIRPIPREAVEAGSAVAAAIAAQRAGIITHPLPVRAAQARADRHRGDTA